ncbi:MAG: M20/M25/M40 family metallo-hydrolase [Firmicutes bacterium]|nr:M20/M25/M40 family metallo-hydrolase [Bacillota bacterium]
MSAVLEWLTARQEEMVDALRRAVEIESPSDHAAALHRFADWLVPRGRAVPGAEVEQLPDPAGPMVRIALPGSGRPVLLLAHFDTVWPLGTLERMPVRLEDGRLYGPGAFDMKAGLVQGLYALAALAACTRPAERPPVVLLCTSDEETGSDRSRARIEEEARRSRAVLVLEPAMGPEGALKTWRKGVGGFTVEVRGRAAHAGGDHAAGRNAIVELARHILDLERLTDYERGTTVNVGVVSGGTRSNVVPERAVAEIDFRVMTVDEAERLERVIRGLAPHAEGFQVHVEGGLNRPPLEERMTRELFALAQEAARGLGFEVAAGGTGGGSDGNFTAAIGVPTLDGLGAVGDGAHGPSAATERST